MHEPLAIIGIGCRFPGAASACAYWRLLAAGRDAVAGMPEGRAALGPFAPDGAAESLAALIAGSGYLKQIDRFDPLFFGVSPREAELMDPQQRLLLESAWEALEDAGVHPEKVRGGKIGVFAGLWSNDYDRLMYAEGGQLDLHAATGGGRFSAAGRVSFFFDLRGPSLTVDTATSSSLAAVYLACESIWSGRAEMALAGGANVVLQSGLTATFERSGMLSPRAKCRFGDAGADGFVRSEGAGMVLLKPLGAARAAGDPIYAVIRGGAMNNDGQGSGHLVRPARDAQTALVVDAWKDAGLEAAQAQYIEAHGTGTPTGDPVELDALAEAIGPREDGGWKCRVGSSKTNIGHTEAAAGVAGLIKLALAMKHGLIPASLHFHRPTAGVAWSDMPLTIAAEATEWPEKSRRLGGVSSFGLTGTNVHLVLEHRPEFDNGAGRDANGHDRSAREAADEGRESALATLVVISAKSERALAEQARRMKDFLAAAPDGGERAPTSDKAARLEDVAHTLGIRRKVHEWRWAAAVETLDDLREELTRFEKDERADWSVRGHAEPAEDEGEPSSRRVAFIYSGQGAKFIEPGRQLLRDEPVFRQTIEACAEALDPQTGWSLIDVLSSESSDWHERMDIFQPAIFSLQVGLTELWRSWGVEPEAVAGHSLGEVAAAYVAGALTLDDAAKVIHHRGRLVQQEVGTGRMAAIGLPADEVEKRLASYGDQAGVATENSPTATAIWGDLPVLEEFTRKLESEGVFARILDRMNYPSHSPRMERCKQEIEEALRGIKVSKPKIEVMSTVRGGPAHEGDFDARYWGLNVRERVRFAPAISALAKRGFGVFVELGVHPMLQQGIEESCAAAGRSTLIVGSLRRGQPERRTMLRGLGELVARGLEPKWDAVLLGRGRLAKVPHYAWDRRRYWYKAVGDGADEAAAETAEAAGASGERTQGKALRELAAAPAGRSRSMAMERLVRSELARVLKLDEGQIEHQRPFKSLGLDSILGMELRRRLEELLDLKIPPMAVWNYSHVAAQAEYLMGRIEERLRDAERGGNGSSAIAKPASEADRPEEPADGDVDLNALLNEVEQLSDDEVRKLLSEDRETTQR